MQPFPDDIKLTVEVTGIYGLAQEWIDKLDDPTEQGFEYNVKTAGAIIKGGKAMPKDDPELSKADDTSAKDKKAPPKGKATEEVELTPEEQEALNKKIAEREANNV